MPHLTKLIRNRLVGPALILMVWLVAHGCISPNEPPVFEITETDGQFDVRYEWNYKGSRWEYEGRISKYAYTYFSTKERTSSYEAYVLDPLDDEWVNHVAGLFQEQAEQQQWAEWETVSFVLAFVQSMPYTSDEVTSGYDEYPRYPLETIVDGGGDCEDTSILFASIVREMGYGVVLLNLKEDRHIAVGVRISPDLVDDWQGRYLLTYYSLQDREIYAYCETTGEGWELGHKPDKFRSPTAEIIDIF